ncbi:hypothetical protein A5642_24690 [Mycolicibacterium mucogenicum]|uniref:Predicted hydrolase N-terminal domain-containing protein n=3 Tax=Mycobacteriaceae TaxID=1762 RepID=A0A1A0MIC9_MYCMU|nr:hypothetical protein A5642_24690 [Mycolicibacterium mucogenicum]
MDSAIQSGAPGEIDELANAFRNASGCITETEHDFTVAKQRFGSAWDRQDGGGHPINDAAEVVRVTESLHLSKLQISKLAVSLESIAAALAQSQRSSATSISLLEGALKSYDLQIDARIAEASRAGESAKWDDLKRAAESRTCTAVDECKAIRTAYTDELSKGRAAMVAEGYAADPTTGADGIADAAPGQSSSDKYGSSHRSADEVLANAPGPWSPEKQAASNRLRDYATATNPNATPEAKRYASERLDDFITAQTQGPLPSDPVLGGDARTRARDRLNLQAKLERGLANAPGLTPDQATAALDQTEAQARMMVIAKVQEELQQMGMSPQGAAQAATGMSHGQIPKELVDSASLAGKGISGAEASVNQTVKSMQPGHPWNPSGEIYSAADTEALKKIGSRVGHFGTALDLGVALYEVTHGMPVGQSLSKVGGGMAGAWMMGALGAEVGAVAGPPGVVVGGFVGGTVGSFIGESTAEAVYKKVFG